jgi:hypothetical protein
MWADDLAHNFILFKYLGAIFRPGKLASFGNFAFRAGGVCSEGKYREAAGLTEGSTGCQASPKKGGGGVGREQKDLVF